MQTGKDLDKLLNNLSQNSIEEIKNAFLIDCLKEDEAELNE